MMKIIGTEMIDTKIINTKIIDTKNWNKVTPFKRNQSAQTLKIGRISYMNVAPIYFGLDSMTSSRWFEIISATPSGLNKMLSNNELDISPISSFTYAFNQDDWLIMPDMSISCFGEVMSVKLVSRYPFKELDGKKVILTDESATAAALLQLLFAFDNINPLFEKRLIRIEDIQNADAALIIGDKAIRGKWYEYFPYITDLGDMWKNKTGLPFVFALWAIRKPVVYDRFESVSLITELFRASKYEGIRNIEKIAFLASVKLGLSIGICKSYYKKLLYDLDPFIIKGLECFFNELYSYRFIPNKVSIEFLNDHI